MLSCEGMMREKMPQCGMSSQISIHSKGLRETPWVLKDALSMSRNGQINYKINSHKPFWLNRGLTKCPNNLDIFNSGYLVGGICRHLKGMIHWRVSRKMVYWGNCHCPNITIDWKVIGNDTVKTQRSGSSKGSFKGSSRHKSSIL